MYAKQLVRLRQQKTKSLGLSAQITSTGHQMTVSGVGKGEERGGEGREGMGGEGRGGRGGAHVENLQVGGGGAHVEGLGRGGKWEERGRAGEGGGAHVENLRRASHDSELEREYNYVENIQRTSDDYSCS